jgi:hypothetical protein
METIFLQRASENWIEAGNERSEAERRTDQTAGASTRTTCAEGRSAGAGADLASQPTHAAAGSVLHNSRIHAESRGTGARAQDVGVGNVQVVAGDGDVKIVLQRERDRIIERQVELAVAHEGIDTGRVGQVGRRQVPRGVRRDRVGKMRDRLGVIQHRKRPGLRRVLRDRRCGRVLGPTCHGQGSEQNCGSSQPDGRGQACEWHLLISSG